MAVKIDRSHERCSDCKFQRKKIPPCVVTLGCVDAGAACKFYKKARPKKKVIPYFQGSSRYCNNILAIDPGPEYSGYCVMDEKYLIRNSGKILNTSLIAMIRRKLVQADSIIQEMLVPFGGAGKSICDTLVWLGRFEEAWSQSYGLEYYKVLRISTRSYFMPSKKELPEFLSKHPKFPKTMDSKIRYILIDRWKREFGIDLEKVEYLKADAWQALCVAVFFMDKQHEQLKLLGG